MEKSYKEFLQNITTFVFDVDGVFTDGTLLITSTGEMLRKMDVKDGYALKTALMKGYNVCIISGGTNEGVRERMHSLGVKDIYLGAHHKEKSILTPIRLNQKMYCIWVMIYPIFPQCY